MCAKLMSHSATVWQKNKNKISKPLLSTARLDKQRSLQDLYDFHCPQNTSTLIRLPFWSHFFILRSCATVLAVMVLEILVLHKGVATKLSTSHNPEHTIATWVFDTWLHQIDGCAFRYHSAIEIPNLCRFPARHRSKKAGNVGWWNQQTSVLGCLVALLLSLTMNSMLIILIICTGSFTYHALHTIRQYCWAKTETGEGEPGSAIDRLAIEDWLWYG